MTIDMNSRQSTAGIVWDITATVGQGIVITFSVLAGACIFMLALKIAFLIFSALMAVAGPLILFGSIAAIIMGVLSMHHNR